MPRWMTEDILGTHKRGKRWTYCSDENTGRCIEVAVYCRQGNDFFEISWIGEKNPLYGPYATLEDAKAAALMFAEITEKPSKQKA